MGEAGDGGVRRWPWSGPRVVPSRTSQAVAVVRAGLDRPASPGGDPEAQAKLCAGMATPGARSMRGHLVARTRFVDGQVVAALARGIGQIVILGAGYDDRALRFRAPGVRFFELDHPDTQGDKRRRLAAIQADVADLTLAPIDFRCDDVAAVLAANGHDADRASLFVCEGLLVYLDQRTIMGLLRGLRSRANGESQLAASLAVHPANIGTEAAVAAANARRRNAAAEPWQTILPVAAHLDVLSSAGWILADPADAVDDSAIERRARPGWSLLVVAQPK